MDLFIKEIFILLTGFIALITVLLDYFNKAATHKKKKIYRVGLIILIFLSTILSINIIKKDHIENINFKKEIDSLQNTNIELSKLNNQLNKVNSDKLDTGLNHFENLIKKNEEINNKTLELINISHKLQYPVPKSIQISFDLVFDAKPDLLPILDSLLINEWHLSPENVFYDTEFKKSWLDSSIDFSNFTRNISLFFVTNPERNGITESYLEYSNVGNSFKPIRDIPLYSTNYGGQIKIFYNPMVKSITIAFSHLELEKQIINSRYFETNLVPKSILDLSGKTLLMRLKYPKSIQNPKVLNFMIESDELTISRDSLIKGHIGQFYSTKIDKL